VTYAPFKDIWMLIVQPKELNMPMPFKNSNPRPQNNPYSNT